MEEIFYKIVQKKKHYRLIKIQQQCLIEYESTESNIVYVILKLSNSVRFTPILQIYANKIITGWEVYDSKTSIVLHNESKQIMNSLLNILGWLIFMVNYQKIMIQNQKVGQGNFAQVYKVNFNDGGCYAFKKFDKKIIQTNQKKLRSFNNQLNILKKLKSPYLARFQCAHISQTNYFLQMSYYDGGTLKDLLNERKLKISQQQKILRDILNGLCTLKSLNIIHRDIKPDNIMIDIANQQIHYVIVDFGLATFADDDYIFYRCGTPGYLSPEIANMSQKTKKFNVSSDMFSVGAVFFQIISEGKPLFRGKNIHSLLHKNKECFIDFQSEVFKKFRPSQIDLIKRMLQKNPNLRITPQQALKHKYFAEEDDIEMEEIPDQEMDLRIKMKKLMPIRPRNTIISLTEASSVGQSNYDLSDDGCLTFQNLQKKQKTGYLFELKMNLEESCRKKSRFSDCRPKQSQKSQTQWQKLYTNS